MVLRAKSVGYKAFIIKARIGWSSGLKVGGREIKKKVKNQKGREESGRFWIRKHFGDGLNFA